MSSLFKSGLTALSGVAALAVALWASALQTAAHAGAPQSDGEPKFEVAAIKPSRGDAPPRVTGPTPREFAATSMTVRGLIAAAFGTMGRCHSPIFARPVG
jgi:hypothetical protein